MMFSLVFTLALLTIFFSLKIGKRQQLQSFPLLFLRSLLSTHTKSNCLDRNQQKCITKQDKQLDCTKSTSLPNKNLHHCLEN